MFLLIGLNSSVGLLGILDIMLPVPLGVWSLVFLVFRVVLQIVELI
jgi:hypothetical protein